MENKKIIRIVLFVKGDDDKEVIKDFDINTILYGDNHYIGQTIKEMFFDLVRKEKIPF